MIGELVSKAHSVRTSNSRRMDMYPPVFEICRSGRLRRPLYQALLHKVSSWHFEGFWNSDPRNMGVLTPWGFLLPKCMKRFRYLKTKKDPLRLWTSPGQPVPFTATVWQIKSRLPHEEGSCLLLCSRSIEKHGRDLMIHSPVPYCFN